MSKEISNLQYTSYSDIDVIRGLLNKSQHQQQSNYLGNTKEPKIVKPAVNMNHVVPSNITEETGDYKQIINIDEPIKKKDNKTDDKTVGMKTKNTTKKPIVNNDLTEIDAFLSVLKHDLVGTFYFASVTIIGLYIVFRMIKK